MSNAGRQDVTDLCRRGQQHLRAPRSRQPGLATNRAPRRRTARARPAPRCRVGAGVRECRAAARGIASIRPGTARSRALPCRMGPGRGAGSAALRHRAARRCPRADALDREGQRAGAAPRPRNDEQRTARAAGSPSQPACPPAPTVPRPSAPRRDARRIARIMAAPHAARDQPLNQSDQEHQRDPDSEAMNRADQICMV